MVAIVLATAGLTYFLVERDAESRILALETHHATRLAECEEGSATRRIEMEGQLAECELDRLHRRCATTGDHVDEAPINALRGRSDLHVGDICRVEVDWNDDPMEGCRAFVRCGEHALYGDLGEGFFACTVDEDGLVHGEDAAPTAPDGEGDPRFVIDRRSEEITVSDDTPSPWSVTLAFRAPQD